MTEFEDIRITGWEFAAGEPTRPDEGTRFHLALSGKPPKDWARAFYNTCRPLQPKYADDWVSVLSHDQRINLYATLKWMETNKDKLKKMVSETNAWYVNWLDEQDTAKKDLDDLKGRLNFD